jgi:hypothetical protein
LCFSCGGLVGEVKSEQSFAGLFFFGMVVQQKQ